MDKKRHEALQNVNLVDVSAMSVNEDLVKYNDDELVIVDKLREIPQLGSGKIDFNVVAACITGCMRLEVSGQPTTVNAQQIFVCHPHVVLSNLMISPDFECKVMCLSDRLLRSILQSQMLIWNNMLRIIFPNIQIYVKKINNFLKSSTYHQTASDSTTNCAINGSTRRIPLNVRYWSACCVWHCWNCVIS